MYMLQEMLISLFKAAGFTCNDYRLHERQIENRRQQVVMHRRWVQAIFTYTPETVDPPLAATSPQAGAVLLMMNPPHAGGCPSAVDPPPAGGPPMIVNHPQAQRPPLQAQAFAQPKPPPAHMEGHNQLSAGSTAAQLASSTPSPQNSSDTNQQQCTASGNQALPSVQHAAATDQQLAWQQQPAASQHQQSLSPVAAMLAIASQSPQHGCLAQPIDKQQARSHQDLAGASDLLSTSYHSQQGLSGVRGSSSTVAASAPGLETQRAAGVASACSSATQGQEWEQSRTGPDQEPITGCLFAHSTLEEVLLGSCLAVCAWATISCCCACADQSMVDNVMGIGRTNCSESQHFSCVNPAQHHPDELTGR